MEDTQMRILRLLLRLKIRDCERNSYQDKTDIR